MTYKLEILKTIQTAQDEHGLRNDDYLSYRKFCTHRIQRLRKALNPTVDNGGDKALSMQPGRDRALENDPNFILLLLTETERNWAYAMDLKSQAADEPRKRHHLIRKLKHAHDQCRLLYDTVVKMTITDNNNILDAEVGDASFCYMFIRLTIYGCRLYIDLLEKNGLNVSKAQVKRGC